MFQPICRFVLWFALANGTVLLAQDATVTGIVSDSADAVMPGVAIKIRNTDTNIARSVQTNSEGSDFATLNWPTSIL
jgi:hypothetical protein